MEIKGKAAIVTGASSDDGIGSECAKILASRGCNVIVNYATNKAGGEKVAAACKAAGARRDRGAGRRVEGRGLQAAGAGLRSTTGAGSTCSSTMPPPPSRSRTGAWTCSTPTSSSASSRVNVIGNYQMYRAAAPHLKASGDAAIVNISSVGAMRAGGSSMAYTASKAALNNLTLSMARALAPEVRVNALCPGGMLGAWTRKILTEKQYEERVRAREDRISAQARHLARTTSRSRRCSWSRAPPR